MSPSSITASAAAAVIGLVVDATRNSESRRTGAPRPPDSELAERLDVHVVSFRHECDEAGYPRVANVLLSGREYPLAQ